MGSPGWRFWVDRGGTFTDVVARSPEGELHVRKVLSVQPAEPGDPAVRAIRELIGLPLDPGDGPAEPIPAGLIAEVRLGTTVATNAVLEQRGRPTLLLVNRGFADLLVIGDQHRPDLFALEIRKPEPLAQRVLEVGGRLAVDGTELEPLQCDDQLAAELRQAQADGLRCVAVALLHAYRHPRHERALGAWLETFGFEQIALSHRVSALPRLLPRAHTTVLEASVGPVLRGYLAQVQEALGPGVPLVVMQSSGGLITPQRLRAKDTILSGPAGGLVGASRIGAALGLLPLVGFDMGGTSTDVSYSSGAALERRDHSQLAGLPLQAPMLDIHTVAAGGGSLIRYDGLRLQVGPASAGADPGPAAYGRGGPLTVTDANVLLGRLQPEHGPAVFGVHGDQPLDRQAVQRGFSDLARAMGCSPEQAAAGALAVAVERMAEAIRRISIQQGHDVREAVLCSFGGAGGQHACAVAEALGMRRVLLHPLAGVLSAYGIGLADVVELEEHTLRQPLSADLLQQLAATLPDPSSAGAAQLLRCTLQLRSPGSDTCLPVPWPVAPGAPGAPGTTTDADALIAAFAAEHQRRFGYRPAGVPVLERLSCERITPGAALAAEAHQLLGTADAPATPVPPSATVPVFLAGSWQPLPLWRREQLVAGQGLIGPALIVEATGCNLLLPGWQGRQLADGSLLLELHSAARPPLQRTASLPDDTDSALRSAGLASLDPIRLELFSHRFTAIAEQMGSRLQQTSSSVNIKERLDFSCALFDRQGRLVANAPHIPVHLGSMGESVAALLDAVTRRERPPLQRGDVVVSNNPYNGGTHLPDLTVITPVFSGAGAEPVAFVASRGHHADVGGITPGSMPPHSTTIAEEGLLLDNVPFLTAGRFEDTLWQQRLTAGPWPVRNPEQLLADLRAQLAANQLGLERLEALIAAEGLAVVQAAMVQVQQQAAEAVRRVIAQLRDGEAVVELDGGARIVVAVRIDQHSRCARIDFSGTSPQQPGNLNAPLAITKAVVLYGFRCLVPEPIPLNAGCFEPLNLVVPPGCLLHPQPPAAVVAGNVETSQAAANALFAALGVLAAGQGTMNNLTLGNARRQYYETICGGAGAGRGFAGAAAVQTHMTNSRLTDPELLEERMPVRLERFAIRRGSGGRGRWPGGDGVIRELQALAPLTLSLLSGARRVPPAGLAGGGSGALGLNTRIDANGVEHPLPGSIAVDLQPGERVRIATPGGGGYGPVGPAVGDAAFQQAEGSG